MLVLTRKKNESVTITDKAGNVILEVLVNNIDGGQVSLAFKNDESETTIYRSELANTLPLERKVIAITAIGTGEQNKGEVFEAKPDIHGNYAMFKKGSNKLEAQIKVSNLTTAYERLKEGYKIYVTSRTGSSTAQRVFKSCHVEFI